MVDLTQISQASWQEAERRAMIIRPLAAKRTSSIQAVHDAAIVLGLSDRHVYTLIRRCKESNGVATSLIGNKPTGGRGKPRIANASETLLHEILEDMYGTKQKLNAAVIVLEVRRRALSMGLKPPSESTIRRRIDTISSRLRRKRGEDVFASEPVKGSFPIPACPLAVVQMDHTLVDVMVVDPVERLPIGRPYLTVAIDVYSRCIAGFHLTLEAPSATSVGLCLTHVAMEKSTWLNERQIDAEWPIFGKPDCLHLDNATEFHSHALERGCSQHGIALTYRPPGRPHYGGIVERVIGTLMQLIHQLPGTTFSNVAQRGDYPSESMSCLTLMELERWLAIAISKYYHLRLHQSLQETPLQRFITGRQHMKASGKMLAQVTNGKAFLLDFLPVIQRTVQRHGFTIDNITYYSNGLRPWIAERHKLGKFLIRRDPRDLSRIYVLDPEQGDYLEVPYRSLSHPSITLFEHRLAVKRLRERGQQTIDERALFKAVEEMRTITQAAAAKSKAARRTTTRSQQARKDTHALYRNHNNTPLSADSAQLGEDSEISPYPDIELWE